MDPVISAMYSDLPLGHFMDKKKKKGRRKNKNFRPDTHPMLLTDHYYFDIDNQDLADDKPCSWQEFMNLPRSKRIEIMRAEKDTYGSTRNTKKVEVSEISQVLGNLLD